METIILIISTLYATLILVFSFGFIRTKNFKLENKPAETSNGIQLSVLIPLKNEAENIPKLLAGLKHQSLHSSLFELIFIDDFSNDNSFSILKSAEKDFQNIQILKNKFKQGKKYALKTGILQAKGKLIVSSDADCTQHPDRLAVIWAFYKSSNAKMIIAPVLFRATNFFGKIQALDFMSLTASGYGSASAGHPVMCNGANFIYEKALFFEFENQFRYDIASGDDMFLLHAAKTKYRKHIRFLKSRQASVYCKPVPNLPALIKQRLRWASKSTSYTDKATIITAIIVFLTHLTVIFSLLSVFFNQFSPIFLLPALLKFGIDFVFLSINAFWFKQSNLLKYFPATWLFSLLFNSYIALISFSANTKQQQ